MWSISDSDIRDRIERDNPWWGDAGHQMPEANYPRRVYMKSFKAIALDRKVKRATVLMGPRRVGKTFMIKQMISEVLNSAVLPSDVMYISIDTPVYSGMPLEHFIKFMPVSSSKNKLIVFDEIQYLKNWEIHLKDLVDSYPDIKFIATGSAAAALRLKSQESGAGRFSEFMLPPLTFYEFLMFLGEDEKLIDDPGGMVDLFTHKRGFYRAKDIEAVNRRFIDYLNYGGYPEAVLNNTVRTNPDQFIRNDIVYKVLLNDLPSLYGIHEVQELSKLFTFLAYNAGNEASLENISHESGITKPTIKRYIEYLESAFLIIKVPNVDDNCKSMKRERNFKIYLNNPSMRAALFAPVDVSDGSLIGRLAESAIFSQWQHSSSFRQLRYARWRNEGEVDVVYLAGPRQQAHWIGEVKWSDRVVTHAWDETKAMQTLFKNHPSIKDGFITSRTHRGELDIIGKKVSIVPAAMYCYTVGKNVTAPLSNIADATDETIEEAA